jgi:hypothetical protein
VHPDKQHLMQMFFETAAKEQNKIVHESQVKKFPSNITIVHASCLLSWQMLWSHVTPTCDSV